MNKIVEALSELNEEEPLTYPLPVYADYLLFFDLELNKKTVKLIEEIYYGEFISNNKFLEALHEDYSPSVYPNLRVALINYEKIKNKYYFKK